MYRDLIAKMKYMIVLAVFLVAPAASWAQAVIPFDPFPATSPQNTETSMWIQYYYWDLRDRDSFLQVTNITSGALGIHVQIFDSAQNCLRVSFFDSLTRFDTHIYDMRNIQRNIDGTTPVLVEDGGYGFVAISVVFTDDFFDALSDEGFFNGEGVINSLIGNFRIVDADGYEYRTNSVGLSRNFVIGNNAPANIVFPLLSITSGYSINYNDQDFTNASDIIGIPSIITIRDDGVIDVFAGAPIVALFNPTYYNMAEDPRDCPNVAFSCAAELTDPIRAAILGIGGITTVTGFNLGISPIIPNSKGGDNMCSVADNAGWIDIDNAVFFFDPDGSLLEPFHTIIGNFFVGFTGLNNGLDVGSMDSWHERGCVSDIKDIFAGNDLDNGFGFCQTDEI